MKRHSHHDDSIDQAFDTYLEKSRQQFVQKQAQFAKSIQSYKRWNFDFDKCEIKFSSFLKRKRYSMVPIATIVADASDWLWVWANDSMPQPAIERSSQIRALTEKTQYNIFDSPHFKVDGEDIDDLCAIVLNHLNAEGIFKDKNTNTWVIIAVNPPTQET